MNVRDFFWNGVDTDQGRLRRSNHQPLDKIEAKGESSFDYSGEVTEDMTQDGKRTRKIDKTITYVTIDDSRRKQAQTELNDLEKKAYFAGSITGVTGIGFCVYTFANGYYKSGITGGLLNLAMTFRSFDIAIEAGNESRKWNDQINDISNTRQKFSSDYNFVMNNKFRGKYFTSLELQDIYDGTVSRLNTEFEQNVITGNPKAMEQWIHHFFQESSPFQQRALDDAFGKNEVIFNPRKPNEVQWKREDLDNIAKKFNTTARRYSLFMSENQQKIENVRNEQLLGQTTINAGNLIGNSLLQANKKEALAHYKDERDRQLAELEKNKNQLGYEKKRRDIIEAFKNNPAVKKIKKEEQQNKSGVNLVSLSTNTLWSLHKNIQVDNIQTNRRTGVINEFSQPIAELFEEYRGKKMKPE